MPGDRHELSAKAAAAWQRYDLVVRFGGTPEEREFAFGLAVKAESALAAYDFEALPAERREAAARALSGA